VERGLIGPNEVPRLWERHLLNCAALAPLVPRGCSLADLGSGAGLPGIVLALMLPECEVTLVEPMLRRAVFLGECATALRLGNVRVCRARAEDLAGQLEVDVVTARALARLDRLARLAAGLLRPGGTLLALKGTRARAELAAARSTLRELGVREADVVRVPAGMAGLEATVIRLTAGQGPHRGA
jgi:16S rRNA (guanine527-N7)-methyltransferase